MSNSHPALVDPWHMQRTLMEASSQTLPAEPVLHKGVILYAALNLEEGHETIHGLHRALERIVGAVPEAQRDDSLKALADIAKLLGDISPRMKATSKAVRTILEPLPEAFRADLLEDEVIEMTDGTTDLTVTNSGFALALGLDGGACYNEVAGSNLSKRNDDGVIDKTPDGKWIKNPKNYREPDLRKVVYPQKYASKPAAESVAAE